MQDRFYGRVGALYGLSRGEKRLEGQPARRHKSVVEYKAESRRVQAELIGFMDIDGVWCVFHAMVPPTKKFKRELGWR